MAPNLVNKLRIVKDKSDHKYHKLSAVLLYKGRPINFGFNSLRTDPKIKKYSQVKAMHAEMSVIFGVKNKEILKHCTMVIFREDREGNPAMAKSCDSCETIMREYGIKKVIYSTKDGWIKETLK